MSEATTLTESLREMIADYLANHRGRSLSTLAKASGLGYTTVRRLAQGEAIPNQETALAIIDVILKPSQKIAFLKTHFPKTGKLVAESYPEDIQGSSNHEALRWFRSLEVHNFIFNLAGTARGTSRAQIQKLWGERGLVALEELLNAEILHEAPSGQIQYEKGSWACTNVDEVLQQLRHSTVYFDKTLIGTEAALLSHITATVNKEALLQISRLLREFALKIMEIKNHPDSLGEIPFYMDLMMSLYDKEKFL